MWKDWREFVQKSDRIMKYAKKWSINKKKKSNKKCMKREKSEGKTQSMAFDHPIAIGTTKWGAGEIKSEIQTEGSSISR